MGHYNELISGLKENFTKALSDLDSLLLNVQELLTSLESASGGDIEVIREDLQKYCDAYSIIRETADTRINGIKSRADEYDGWYDTWKGKIGEIEHSYRDDYDKNYRGSCHSERSIADVFIRENGLIYVKRKTRKVIVEWFQPKTHSESYKDMVISEMRGFLGRPWNGSN